MHTRNEPIHSETHTELVFESFTEFIEFTTRQAAINPHATGHDTNAHFRHTRDLAECLDLARTGWSEGRTAITKIADKLNVSSRVKVPELYFDVCGDYGYDMGRHLSGEPESAICFHETELDSPNTSGQIIKITANATISASVDKQIYMSRGAALVALIDTLETAGKRVELNVVWTSKIYNYGYVTLNIPLKDVGSHVQIDQIAFALAHPSFVRRLCFIAHGAINAECLKSSNSYCGQPSDYPLGSPDIYMPRMHGSEPQWASIRACQEWTVNKLRELGVELISED